MSVARALCLGKCATTTTERTARLDFRSCLDRVLGTDMPNLERIFWQLPLSSLHTGILLNIELL